MTAVNADLSDPHRTGDEYLIAIGIFLALLDTGRPGGSPSLEQAGIAEAPGRTFAPEHRF